MIFLQYYGCIFFICYHIYIVIVVIVITTIVSSRSRMEGNSITREGFLFLCLELCWVILFSISFTLFIIFFSSFSILLLLSLLGRINGETIIKGASLFFALFHFLFLSGLPRDADSSPRVGLMIGKDIGFSSFFFYPFFPRLWHIYRTLGFKHDVRLMRCSSHRIYLGLV